MTEWISQLAGWLADFSWIATVLLAAALVMRLVLRAPASRVMLAWGTWASVAASAVLIATPWWPRIEFGRLVELNISSPPLIAAEHSAPLAEPTM